MKNFMAFVMVLLAHLLATFVARITLGSSYPVAYAGVITAIWAFYCFVVLRTSIYRIALDHRIGSFWWGSTFLHCYAGGSDYKKLRERYEAATQMDIFDKYCRNGQAWLRKLGFANILFLQWPFISTRPVTTKIIRVIMKPTDVWTAFDNRGARTQVQCDVDIMFGIGVKFDALLQTMPDVPWHDPAKMPEAITNNVAAVVTDAVRRAISGFTQFNENGIPIARHLGYTWGDPRDVEDHKPELERWVRFLLSNQSESVFVQSELLPLWTGGRSNGPGSSVIDISIENITPTEATVRNAESSLVIADREAEAKKRRERGRTAAIQERATTLGIDTGSAATLEALLEGKANVGIVTGSLRRFLNRFGL